MKSHQQIHVVADASNGNDFLQTLAKYGITRFAAQSVEILQINITRKCNLSCKHCHYESGPDQSAEMPKNILDSCAAIASLPQIKTIDITGGAPETHPHLETFLAVISHLNKRVIVRSNLAILAEKQFEKFIDIYANFKVELVASLPEPSPRRTDRQRGDGVFEQIITVMKKLNTVGYGLDNSPLLLNLVHNPAGAFLAGAQQNLEKEYKRKLSTQYGVSFSHLFCLNNCPIGRYLHYLIESDNLNDYMEELINAFNKDAAENAMCRSTVSVGVDGTLYDCDFHQALNLPIHDQNHNHITTFDYTQLSCREIITKNHCYACTAGAGSSCQGETS